MRFRRAFARRGRWGRCPHTPEVFLDRRSWGIAAIFAAAPVMAASAEIVFEGGGETLVVQVETLDQVELRRRGDGVPEVLFRLDKTDASQFELMTTRIEGKTLTVSMCGVVLASPTVMWPIVGGDVMITGGTDAGSEALFEALEGDLPCPEGASS